LLLIFLLGCASTSEPQDPDVLSNTHGYVFVHFPRTHPGLEVKAIKNKKKYSLELNHLNKTSGLWLPEGTYRLSKAFYGVGGNGFEGYPSIEVKAGQVTSLGSLINFSVGEDKNIWLQKSFSLTKELEQQYIKKFSKNLASNELNHWKLLKIPEINTVTRNSSGQGLIVDWMLSYTDSNQEGKLKNKLLSETNVESFYSTALKTLPPFSRQEPAEDKLKNLYYGAELGQIKKRSAKGVWTTINTGSLENISKVYWLDDILYAASINKRVIRSLDNGTTWEVISSFPAEELILDIDHYKDHLYILTSQKTDAASAEGLGFVVTIYKTSTHNFDNISVIKHIPHEGVILRDPKAEIANGHYYVGFEPTILKYMNITTGKWFDVPLPQKFTTYNVANNGLISLFNIQGAFSDLFISENQGISWSELDTPSYIIEDVFFTSKGQGVSHRTEMNAFSLSFFIQQYNAVKGKWVNISKAPDECKYLIENKERLASFCVTKSDGILSFKNNKWLPESIM